MSSNLCNRAVNGLGLVLLMWQILFTCVCELQNEVSLSGLLMCNSLSLGMGGRLLGKAGSHMWPIKVLGKETLEQTGLFDLVHPIHHLHSMGMRVTAYMDNLHQPDQGQGGTGHKNHPAHAVRPGLGHQHQEVLTDTIAGDRLPQHPGQHHRHANIPCTTKQGTHTPPQHQAPTPPPQQQGVAMMKAVIPAKLLLHNAHCVIATWRSWNYLVPHWLGSYFVATDPPLAGGGSRGDTSTSTRCEQS